MHIDPITSIVSVTRSLGDFIKVISLFLLCVSFCSIAQEIEVNPYLDECRFLSRYVVKDFKIGCEENYLHFNSEVGRNYSPYKSSKVEIATFNVLHPGFERHPYKDFSIMAKMLNDWDIVALQEVIPVMGDYSRSNTEIREEVLSKGAESTKNLLKLYKAPKIIELLRELRKIDSSWSLILSPNAEVAKGYIFEFAAFLYRGSKVKLAENPHCKRYYKEAFACYPDFSKKFMGRETNDVFSKRPFLASFKSRNFDFSLLTNHVIWTSPSDEQRMKTILSQSFGVSDYRDLGQGVTKRNYARFAETFVAMDFLDRYRDKYKDDQIILLGDFNIVGTNDYWPHMFSRLRNRLQLHGMEASTLKVRRYNSDGSESLAESSNYDHFILDKQSFPNCHRKKFVERTKFTTGKIARMIDSKYIIRRERSVNGEIEYSLKKSARSIMKRVVDEYEDDLKESRIFKSGKIVPYMTSAAIGKKVESIKKRLFEDQFDHNRYYKVFKEIVSDHFPISINCSNR